MGLAWGNKKNLWFLLAALAALVGIALFLFLPIRASNLTAGDTGWTTSGCFEQGSVYPTTRFDQQISAHERRGVTLWGSYCGNDASTGGLRSPVFTAPVILELFVAGYPGRPGLDLFLESEEDHRKMPLPTREAGELWSKVRWYVNKDFRGKPVRLVAVDRIGGLGGWLATSNPRSLSLFNLLRFQSKSNFRAIGAYLWQWVMLVLPGFAVANLLNAKSRRPISASYLVMVVICTVAILGYLAFWTFFFSHALGRILSYTVVLVAAGSLVFPLVTPRGAVETTARLIREPFLYALLAGLCYISCYFIFTEPSTPGIGYAGDRFFVEIRPGDNVIPLIFADRIYDRKPVRPFCCGDWLSSDRPPLQAGIVVLERPVTVMKNRELSYELLSSALQCFWICGVWCLLTSIGTGKRRIREVVGFLIFSGFLFYNSVYTWPKLLAATCILFLASIVIEVLRDNRALTYFDAVLGSTCLGLALMAHPGSTFSFAAFGIVLLRFRRMFALRKLALGLLIVVSFYLPWSAYQKFVDPPGNRLLKMHLASVGGIDSRTAWEGIRDSYHQYTWGQIISYKWSNIVCLGGPDFFDAYGLSGIKEGRIDHAATEESRIVQRTFVWNAVGLANLGWLAGLFLLLGNTRREVAVPYSRWLVGAGLVNLLFWGQVTFGPNETQTAHSSYADILLISIGLLGFVLTLPRVVFLLALAWQLFNFFVVWVWSLPARIPLPITFQWPMIAMGVCLALVLLWMTLRQENTAVEA